MISPHDYARLSAAHAAGDWNTFVEILIAVLATPLRKWFQRKGRNDVADDLVQETFLAVLQRCQSLSLMGPPCLTGWVYRVARSIHSAHVRRELAASRDRLREVHDPEAANQKPDGALDPVGAAEIAEELAHAVSQLTPEQLAQLELRAAGHSWREIGEMTGQNPSTIQVRLHRQRKTLRGGEEDSCHD